MGGFLFQKCLLKGMFRQSGKSKAVKDKSVRSCCNYCVLSFRRQEESLLQYVPIEISQPNIEIEKTKDLLDSSRRGIGSCLDLKGMGLPIVRQAVSAYHYMSLYRRVLFERPLLGQGAIGCCPFNGWKQGLACWLRAYCSCQSQGQCLRFRNS